MLLTLSNTLSTKWRLLEIIQPLTLILISSWIAEISSRNSRRSIWHTSRLNHSHPNSISAPFSILWWQKRRQPRPKYSCEKHRKLLQTCKQWPPQRGSCRASSCHIWTTFPGLKEEQRTALKGFHHLCLTLARVWSDAAVFHRWWCASGISPHTSSCSEEFWLAGFEWQRQKSRPVTFQVFCFFFKCFPLFQMFLSGSFPAEICPKDLRNIPSGESGWWFSCWKSAELQMK